MSATVYCWFLFAHLPTAADFEEPQRARSPDCWPHTAGWSDAPAPVADSPTTKETQSSHVDTDWFCKKAGHQVYLLLLTVSL